MAKKIVKKEELKTEKIMPQKFEKIDKNVTKTDILQKTSISKKALVKKAPAESKEDLYLKELLKKIKVAIEKNRYYPKIAKRLKKEGVVKIEFVLSAKGEIKDIKIVQKSHSILNKSAVKTVKKASIYFPKPKKEIKIVVPIEYRLTQN